MRVIISSPENRTWTFLFTKVTPTQSKLLISSINIKMGGRKGGREKRRKEVGREGEREGVEKLWSNSQPTGVL